MQKSIPDLLSSLPVTLQTKLNRINLERPGKTLLTISPVVLLILIAVLGLSRAKPRPEEVLKGVIYSTQEQVIMITSRSDADTFLKYAERDDLEARQFRAAILLTGGVNWVDNHTAVQVLDYAHWHKIAKVRLIGTDTEGWIPANLLVGVHSEVAPSSDSPGR